MSRITKDLAQRVAKNLVAKKEESLKTLKIEIDSFIKDEYNRSIPEGVLTFYNKFPKYLKETNACHLCGPGVEQKYFVLTNNISIIYSKNSYPNVNFQKNEAIILEKMLTNYESLKKEINNLTLEIEALLFACRTYKKAIETFPECKEYLPDSSDSVYLPAINIDSLRKRLK